MSKQPDILIVVNGDDHAEVQAITKELTRRLGLTENYETAARKEVADSVGFRVLSVTDGPPNEKGNAVVLKMQYAVPLKEFDNDSVLNKDIADIGLSVRAHNILRSVNINTVRELSSYSRAQLSRLPFIGKMTLSLIFQAILRQGLDVRQGSPADPIPSHWRTVAEGGSFK